MIYIQYQGTPYIVTNCKKNIALIEKLLEMEGFILHLILHLRRLIDLRKANVFSAKPRSIHEIKPDPDAISRIRNK